MSDTEYRELYQKAWKECDDIWKSLGSPALCIDIRYLRAKGKLSQLMAERVDYMQQLRRA